MVPISLAVTPRWRQAGRSIFLYLATAGYKEVEIKLLSILPVQQIGCDRTDTVDQFKLKKCLKLLVYPSRIDGEILMRLLFISRTTVGYSELLECSLLILNPLQIG